MKPIRFRALTFENKIIDVFEIKFFTEGAIVNEEVPAKELMQFTGLKDKNGKEIYEGDIVRRISDQWIFTVGWNTPRAQWLAYHTGTTRTMLSEGKFKVIGNIHENPEMLKENK